MNLKTYFKQNIKPNIILKTNENNLMNIPKISKITLNIGVSNVSKNKNNLLEPMLAMEIITGQKPKLVQAKNSISTFNLRKGIYTACKVTLRDDNMYQFISKLNKIVLPKIQDFKGISKNSFDNNGNYSFSIRNLIIFPEIEYQYKKFKQSMGMDISIDIKSRNINGNVLLLSGLQLPYKK